MTLYGWQMPDVVLGAMIAAAITLVAAALTFIGVLLSNRHARLRLQLQLDHEAKQSDRRRQMELRRDVYLPVADAIMRGATAVSRLADVRIDENELMLQLTEVAGVMAKAHVVASDDTVTALVRFQSSLMRNFMELSGARIFLKIRQNEIERVSRDIANEANESSRWVELMKQFNLQCSADQQKWQALASQAELTQRRLHDLTERHAELSASQVRDIIEYARETTKKGLATMRLLPDVLLATRREMELPIDEANYRALSEATAVDAEIVGKQLLNKIPMPDGEDS